LAGVKTDLAGVKTDLAGVKTDLAGVKTDLAGVKTDLAGVKTDLAGMKTEMAGVKTTVGVLRIDLAFVKTEMAEQFAATNKRIDDLSTNVDGFINLHQKLDVELVALRDKYNRVARAHNGLALITAPTADVRV
ncbi:MAG: hypothetical protein V1723_02065, partial [Candidatus Uhrbacteria bacterium]